MNLINDYTLRNQRKNKKINDVLCFLKSETFTTADVLKGVLKFKTISPVYTLLRKLVAEGVICVYSCDLGTGKINIYGLTPHGAGLAMNENDNIADIHIFHPSKTTISVLRHKLDIQLIRIVVETKGHQWLSIYSTKKKKPEAFDGYIITSKSVNKIAVKVERTIKSLEHYRKILGQYIEQQQNKQFDQVYYLLPDVNLKNRVEKIYKSINSVIVGNETITIDEQTWNFIKFFTYEELKNTL
ncbi:MULTISPECIES: MobC family replication-relaxation protein [Photorhabdus]|uniref:MobC family replication-relaxation protein n=1 Tax=Photorhabdus TaxID=29487 RepID=UPI0021D48D9D|nr:MobC family replication-relaxation protein [Photorhabdus kayaii]MCT8351672.1 hypothetical protein [Photorhabdus kayaii]